MNVIINSKGMYDYMKGDPGYDIWKKIEEFVDGERAVVVQSVANEEQYVVLQLENDEKTKELFYMIEQDPVIGIYVDDREEFDKAWDNGEYQPDGSINIYKKYTTEI